MRGEEAETVHVVVSCKKGRREIRQHSWKEIGGQERRFGGFLVLLLCVFLWVLLLLLCMMVLSMSECSSNQKRLVD